MACLNGVGWVETTQVGTSGDHGRRRVKHERAELQQREMERVGEIECQISKAKNRV
jgi:hypothetical protein